MTGLEVSEGPFAIKGVEPIGLDKASLLKSHSALEALASLADGTWRGSAKSIGVENPLEPLNLDLSVGLCCSML